MTKRSTLLAAMVAALAGGTAAGATQSSTPPAPARVAVVAQVPCASSPASVPTLAAVRAAAPAGAPVLAACTPADARVAVLRAVASGHTVVLGSGPDVRAAQGEAAPDHPEVRMGALR